jgi:hypothetical protein
MRSARRLLWLALPAVAAAAALGFAVLAAQRLPDGPVPPVFDRVACAFCRMHVGEPRFAAQVQTARGDVWDYDDPGCLVEHLLDADPEIHAIWFHHLHEERWVAAERAAFVAVQPTPMGFGFGAVDAGAPDAISFAELRARVRAQREARR